MKKILAVFGTRPEAIKMCPLVLEMRKRSSELETVVCVTGQHREMLDQVLDVFKVVPDFDLDIMKPGQTLQEITAAVMERLRVIFEEVKPDVVLVHGDTTTSFAAALCAFYSSVAVGHVEAGLRTYDQFSPWPEEFNRQAIDAIASWYFAPTESARDNLLREGRRADRVFVTGNTAIDALRTTVNSKYSDENLEWASDSRLVLLTAHRRESQGAPMRAMFRAIRRVVEENPDVKVLYPMHKNPLVRASAAAEFADHDRIRLIEPLDVVAFHNYMGAAHLILTDSGGIQEEAPALGKPVLVLRDTTERPEGVDAGTLRLIGTGEAEVYREFQTILNDADAHARMAAASNPYGDGFASQRIADALVEGL